MWVQNKFICSSDPNASKIQQIEILFDFYSDWEDDQRQKREKRRKKIKILKTVNPIFMQTRRSFLSSKFPN